jgi:hypothetical protein
VSEPDPQEDLDGAEQELHQAIAEILGRRGQMVTKWMLSAEMIDAEGGRDLESFTSPDFRAWDSLGFLGFVDARERGVVGGHAATEFLDDDGEGG